MHPSILIKSSVRVRVKVSLWYYRRPSSRVLGNKKEEKENMTKNKKRREMSLSAEQWKGSYSPRYKKESKNGIVGQGWFEIKRPNDGSVCLELFLQALLGVAVSFVTVCSVNSLWSLRFVTVEESCELDTVKGRLWLGGNGKMNW